MKPEMKKLIIANLPYLLFVYLFGKLGQAYRLAEGIDLSQKLLHFADGCAAAFESAAPSFHPTDLLIGVAGAAALRLMQQLDASILREFVDKIYVSEVYTPDENEPRIKVREIEIVYNFIGAFDFEEARDQSQAAQKEKKTGVA